MFGLGDSERYLKNTYLNPEQTQELHQMIGEYLEVRLALSLIEKALEVCEGEESQRELEKLNLPLSYNPSEHPEFLVFEALVGIRISEAQTTNLLRLKENPNSAIEMLMGAGKSTVLSPIWALMQIKHNDKLPIIVAPKSLFPRGKEIAKDSFFKAFGRFGHGFEFSRGVSSQGEKLSLIYQQLLTWKKEKGFIYTTKESILSFILFFEDLFLELEKAEETDKQKLLSHIDEASKILLFFKKECSALFDEAHALLRINEEVNFTVGQCQAIASSEADMIKELVLELLKVDPGALEQNRQAENKDFKGSFYQPLMEFIQKRFHLSSLEYFEGSARKASDEILHHDEKDLIALCKELIERLLPHTLSKKVNEHFGLRENSDVAIPYVANNTSNPSSEFGSPYETFLYTLYYYINQPIRLSSIEKYFHATLELAKYQSLRTLTSVDETSVGIDFKKLYGISLTDPEALAILQTKINASPQTRLDFVMNHFLESIKIYSKKISANPQDLVRIFSQTQLMSGTLWNHQSFSRKFKVFLDETIEKDTIAVIQALKKDECLSLTAIEDDKRVEEILSYLKGGRFNALIDCGALIKNISNEALANKILEATEFQGVVFYNEADELYVLERSGEKKPFDACLISKEHRFTFYDHRHTTGSDIKQAPNARALVSVSEITLKADLYQSLWRMRGLKEKQKIVIIASSTLSLSTPDDLLALVEINQQKRVLEDNFRAQKGEIKAIALAVMREGLAKAQGQSKVVIFDQIKKHLLIEIGGSPFEIFGTPTELVEPQKLILDYKMYWIESLKSLSPHLNVDQAIDEISSLDLVTLAQCYPSKRVEMGIEVENENDQNSDLDIDHQVSQELELIDEPERERPAIFSGKRIEWIQEESIFDPKPIKKTRYQRCIEKIKSMINRFFAFLRLSFRFQEILQPIIFRKFFPETLALKLSETLKTKSPEFDGIFDDNISISSNFLLPYQNTNLFSGPSKPIYRFVVMLHKDKRIETMIIDSTDLKYFREKLRQDKGQSSRKICIYSPIFGITHHGQKEVKLEELMASESFKEQLCQIKFFGGVCDYTIDEQSVLKKWLEKKSPQSMWSLFNKILASHRENKDKFQGSNIQALFSELLKPQD